MDVDRGSSSSFADPTSERNIPVRSRREQQVHQAFYQFTQQNLPACKPVLTPLSVISIFLLTGFICIPIGIITLRTSREVVEIVDRYDAGCVPEEFKGDKVAYIQDSSQPKNCSRFLRVHKFMKAPIYIYYQLDNYYQNHRRYVKSKSDKQLLHGLHDNDTSSCKPLDSSDGALIVPCGLIAWSLFNDTYTFIHRGKELAVNRKNIAWESDREHKFGKDVYPFNFQNGSLIGGEKLDPDIPVFHDHHLRAFCCKRSCLCFCQIFMIISHFFLQFSFFLPLLWSIGAFLIAK